MSAATELAPPNTVLQLPHNPHALIVLNEGSTRFPAAKREAERYFHRNYSEREIDVVYTSRDSGITARRIYDKLERFDYDVVAGLTGDGAINDIARLLIGTNVALYQGGFGGINDGHIAAVGEEELARLCMQPVVPTFPLVTRIRYEGKSWKEIALNYQGLGYTALSSELVNGDKHRKSWLMNTRATKKIREAMTVTKALALNSPYYAFDLTTGSNEMLHEYLISNGARMAGMPLYPGDPTTMGFKEARLHWRTGAIAELVKLAILRNQSSWQDADEMHIRVRGMDDRDVVLQFDGESRRLPSGSTVHTTSSRRPLHVVAPALAEAA